MTDIQKNSDLLKEILPIPSEKIVAARFSTNDKEMAPCSGVCVSGGGCKTVA